MNLNIRLLDPIYTQIVYAQNWYKTSRSITVQGTISHHVCRGLTNEFQAESLQSKRESGVNTPILRFS